MSAFNAPAPFSQTGGVTVGWWRASLGLATLTAHRDYLAIQASRGPWTFAPGDVVAIEPFTYIPLLSWGLRIVHVRPDVHERVLFWTLGPPGKVADAVRAAGFVPAARR